MSPSVSIKQQKDHRVKISPMCGEIFEILTNKDNPHIDIAMVFDIKPTQGHYHLGFEEIYLVIDGCIELAYYDPKVARVENINLGPNELVAFAPGVHHRVTNASGKNRLCVISLPGFDPHDEHVSDKLEKAS